MNCQQAAYRVEKSALSRPERFSVDRRTIGSQIITPYQERISGKKITPLQYRGQVLPQYQTCGDLVRSYLDCPLPYLTSLRFHEVFLIMCSSFYLRTGASISLGSSKANLRNMVSGSLGVTH